MEAPDGRFHHGLVRAAPVYDIQFMQHLYAAEGADPEAFDIPIPRTQQIQVFPIAVHIVRPGGHGFPRIPHFPRAGVDEQQTLLPAHFILDEGQYQWIAFVFPACRQRQDAASLNGRA